MIKQLHILMMSCNNNVLPEVAKTFTGKDIDYHEYFFIERSGEFVVNVINRFVGKNAEHCIAKAVSDGWTFNKDITVSICPYCSRNMSK